MATCPNPANSLKCAIKGRIYLYYCEKVDLCTRYPQRKNCVDYL